VLKLSIKFLKDVDESLHNKGSVSVLLFINSFHFIFEVSVDLNEDRAFTRELLGDISLTSEDTLKIRPFALYC